MVPQEWDLTFIGNDSEIDEIDDFLAARAIDQELFQWTTPEDNSTFKWVCKEWKKEKFDYNASRLTAKFQQRATIDAVSTWVAQITSPTNIPNDAKIIVDSTGNVYIGIIHPGASYGLAWINITKFSASGKLLWSKNINRYTGFGNNIAVRQYSSFFGISNGRVVIAALYENTTDAPSSAYHKIICLNSGDGSLIWAKSIKIISPSTYYDVQYGKGLYVNSVTGNIYIAFLTYRASIGGIGPAVLTLDKDGTITGCLVTQILGSTQATNDIEGIEIATDGTVIVHGTFGSGSYYWNDILNRGYIFTMNSSGTSITSQVTLYGNSTSQAYIRNCLPLSNGYILATDTVNNLLYLINPSNGSFQFVKNPGINLGRVLQIIERKDGTIAILGSAFGPSSGTNSAVNNQWNGGVAPSVPLGYVAIYSSDLTQLIKYKECGVGPLAYGAGSSPGAGSFTKGCAQSIDRYICSHGVYEGFFAITSMNLSDIYVNYPTLPSYNSFYEGPKNTFAKFASATTTLPISTSSASSVSISTLTNTTESWSTTSSDYSSSVVLENATVAWSYFSD